MRLKLNGKNKNIRELPRGMNELRNSYKPGT